jgi:DNA-binding protein|nr:MAG TPA: Helix-turn-helix XRE-family like protein [Inoviridae sp.]
MDYIDRLRALRIDNDIKQKDIAKIINKSQQGYAHIENRKAKLAIEDLTELAKYYQVSLDYLVGLTNDPKPSYIIKNQINVTTNKGNINVN